MWKGHPSVRAARTALCAIALVTSSLDAQDPQQTEQWSLTLVNRIGSAGQAENAQLYEVKDAVFLKDGRIAVLNAGTFEIRIFSAQGDFENSLGREGRGPGEFTDLTAIALLRADTMAVLDRGLRRITLFDSAGAVAGTISLTLPYNGYATALSTYSDGTFGVATLQGSLPSDQPGLVRKSAPFVVVDRSGTVVDTIAVVPGDAWYFHIFDSGASSLGYLPYGPRTSVALLNDRLYVARGDSTTVLGMSRDGNVGAAIRLGWQRGAIGQDDIERYERVRLEGARAGERPRTASMLAELPYPAFAPATGHIVADARGYLWVERYAKPSEPTAHWYVYTPTGRLIETLRLPAEFDILDIRGDRLLALTLDDLDREVVSIYKVSRPAANATLR